jgi:Uma2 family endonuclease
MISTPVKVYTIQEYFQLELKSPTRNEYRNGKIIPMTGGTPTHNEIIGALNVIFRLAINRKLFQVFVTDQRLWIPEYEVHTYSDIMVVPRPIKLQEGRKDTVTEPILIAEVLSKSTKNYDRGEKFENYRSIPSFAEYLLIHQSKPYIEHYTKQDANQWLLTEYFNLSDRIQLTSINLEFTLSELYEDVDFTAL